MRKIFSTVLVATALLFSMQANAINVANETALRDAINPTGKGTGLKIDITLTNDIQLTAPLQIYTTYSQKGDTINLNLNGKTLSNNPSYNISVIELFRGTLNISNGTVKCQWVTTKDAKGNDINCKDAIIVHGTLEEVANWSTLNIARDAKVLSDQNAITLLEFVGIPYQKFTWADDAVAGVKCNDFTLGNNATWNTPADFTTKYPAYRFVANVAEPDKENPYSSTHTNGYNLRYNKSVGENISYTKTSGATVPEGLGYTSQFPSYSDVVRESSTKGDDGSYTDISKQCYRKCVSYVATAAANGATINVAGYVFGKKYGIKVNGTIREKSSVEENAAKVNVLPTAEIVCSDEATPSGKEAIAVYCSGAAEWTINGYVHGNIGVVVKGGEVTIENATIEATGTSYVPVTYQGGSGMNGGAGSAIIVASQSNYTGGQDVTIKGDTKISAESGYAINEVVVTGSNQTSNISIQGGTIESGDQGAMAYTTESVTGGKVSIVGGNVGEGGIYVAGEETELSYIVDNTQKPHFITEVEDEDGHTVLVINEGTLPATKALSALTEGESAVITPAEYVITDNQKVGFIDLTKVDDQTQDGVKITINAGKVFEAEKIVMGPKAQIVVEVGAKLIVNGAEGVYTISEDNIYVKADETGMGMFLFNPAVGSNRTPFATVEVYAKNAFSYPDGLDAYSYDIIVCPFTSLSEINYTLDETKTQPGEGGKWSALKIWKNNKWVDVTRAEACQQLSAFQPIAMTSSADPTKTVIEYQFKGQLQGNVSGLVPAGKNYNYMGNAYLAPMSSADFIDQIKKNATLEKAMWFWDGAHQKFQPVTEDNLNKVSDIAPLGFFILKAKGDVNVDFNYNDLIWTPNKPNK